MGTKTIAIMDDVYKRLVALKSSRESFSEGLRRLMDTKGRIMEFAGAWKDISETDANKMKSGIEKMRKGTRLKELNKGLR